MIIERAPQSETTSKGLKNIYFKIQNRGFEIFHPYIMFEIDRTILTCLRKLSYCFVQTGMGTDVQYMALYVENLSLKMALKFVITGVKLIFFRVKIKKL